MSNQVIAVSLKLVYETIFDPFGMVVISLGFSAMFMLNYKDLRKQILSTWRDLFPEKAQPSPKQFKVKRRRMKRNG